MKDKKDIQFCAPKRKEQKVPGRISNRPNTVFEDFIPEDFMKVQFDELKKNMCEQREVEMELSYSMRPCNFY